MTSHKSSSFESKKCRKYKAISYFSCERVSFEWRVKNFSLCEAKEGDYILSPRFNSSDATWVLWLYPKGRKELEGKILIYLAKCSNDKKEHSVQFNLGLKDKNYTGKQILLSKNVFDKIWSSAGRAVIDISELLNIKRDVFLPDDTLTIWCELEIKKDITHGDTTCVEEEEQEKCASIASLNNLSEEFASLYSKQKNCDVVLKADGKSFPAHKFVLGVRSSVFAAMFVHDMREKESNVVQITAVDAATLDDMLWYIYSGKVTDVSMKKAIDLYTVADKYALLDLKQQCSNYMTANMTVEDFYEVAVIADIHNDVKIHYEVKKFFRANMSLILKAEQWDIFVDENPLVTTHLLETDSFCGININK